MVADSTQDTQFINLAFRYLEEQLTPLEFATLKFEMAANQAKRKAFVQLCLVRAGLIEELRNRAQYRTHVNRDPGGDPGERALSDAMILPAIIVDPQPADTDRNPLAPDFASHGRRPVPSRWKWWPLRVASVVFAALAVGIIWAVLHHANSNPSVALPTEPPTQKVNPPGTQPQENPFAIAVSPAPGIAKVPPPQRVEKLPAAHVAIALDAQLDSDASQNAVLSQGPHTLGRGLIQLALSTGATVVLQAPAQFEVLSESRIVLHRGKLTANVPHMAPAHADLTIETPDLRAVDLGTEFAVSVVPLEQTHLEVFKGQVRAETAADDAGVFASKIVSAAQSVRVESGSTLIQKDLPIPLVFVRADELQSRAVQGGDTGLQRWRAFSSQLRHDPDLIAYYPFDNQSDAPGQLTNRASATLGSHDGTLGVAGRPASIPSWTQGRWQGKSALQFGENSGSVVTIPADPALTPITEMSIAVWLRRTTQSKTEHLLEEADNDVNCFSLTLTGAGSQPSPRAPEAMYLNYTAVPANALKTPSGTLPANDRWCFIAITRDSSGVARCYVDARQVSQSTMTIPELRRAGDLWIGRANPAARGTSSADIFHGLVDELAMFHRALSPQEVQRMYDAGKP